VLVGVPVNTESEWEQMQGRSSRARGVCIAILYVNTGEKASVYRQRLQTSSYSETMDYVELLKHLQEIQPKPVAPKAHGADKASAAKPLHSVAVEVVYEEWNKGRYLTSLKELKEKVILKEAMIA
jgi:hypothetical protein